MRNVVIVTANWVRNIPVILIFHRLPGQMKYGVNFQEHKFRCTFYSRDTLRNALSNSRDKISKEKNNIVYKIPCWDCDAVDEKDDLISIQSNMSATKLPTTVGS